MCVFYFGFKIEDLSRFGDDVIGQIMANFIKFQFYGIYYIISLSLPGLIGLPIEIISHCQDGVIHMGSVVYNKEAKAIPNIASAPGNAFF